jgi:hypothetical protein
MPKFFLVLPKDKTSESFGELFHLCPFSQPACPTYRQAGAPTNLFLLVLSLIVAWLTKTCQPWNASIFVLYFDT